MNMQQTREYLRNDPEALQVASSKLEELLARSATDMAFRRRLIEEPKAALAEFSGRDVAAFEGLDVVFVENKAAATIVLPDPVDAGGELSEDELEAVAGGSAVLVAAFGVAAAALGALAAGMTLD